VTVRCLGCRVDALVLAFDVTFDPAVCEVFERAWSEAAELGGTSLSLRGLTVSVRRSRIPHRLALETADWRGVVEWDGRAWGLELVARAEWLALEPIELVVDDLREVAKVCGEIRSERLRRVDLCADFSGWNLSEDDANGYVVHPRARVTGYTELRKPDERHPNGVPRCQTYRQRDGKVTGHTVCPGNPLMARVYDKTAELAHACPPMNGIAWKPWPRRESKAAFEFRRWLESGWDGVGNVTRLEFQLRGEVLQELCERRVDAVLTELDSWWAYCVGDGMDHLGWMRLVLPGTATRLRRCELDPRWVAVRAVVFRHKQAAAVRVRVRGFATSAQAWGAALGALGEADTLIVPAETCLQPNDLEERAAQHPDPMGALMLAFDSQMERFREVFLGACAVDPAKALAKYWAKCAQIEARRAGRYRDLVREAETDPVLAELLE